MSVIYSIPIFYIIYVRNATKIKEGRRNYISSFIGRNKSKEKKRKNKAKIYIKKKEKQTENQNQNVGYSRFVKYRIKLIINYCLITMIQVQQRRTDFREISRLYYHSNQNHKLRFHLNISNAGKITSGYFTMFACRSFENYCDQCILGNISFFQCLFYIFSCILLTILRE